MQVDSGPGESDLGSVSDLSVLQDVSWDGNILFRFNRSTLQAFLLACVVKDCELEKVRVFNSPHSFSFPPVRLSEFP